MTPGLFSVPWVTYLKPIPHVDSAVWGPACGFALFSDEHARYLVTIALSAPGCSQPSWHRWQGRPPITIMGRMLRTERERERERDRQTCTHTHAHTHTHSKTVSCDNKTVQPFLEVFQPLTILSIC